MNQLIKKINIKSFYHTDILTYAVLIIRSGIKLRIFEDECMFYEIQLPLLILIEIRTIVFNNNAALLP